jgi:hypothetical protein
MISTVSIAGLGKNVTWYGRRGHAKVEEAVGNQNGVCGRIVRNVTEVRRSIGLAVVRIRLSPDSVLFVIYVVANQHYEASVPNGLLVAKDWVAPVFVEGKFGAYAHCENTAACCLKPPASHSYDPVAGHGRSANSWLACGKRANAVERIWREAEVPINDIHEN